MFLLKTVAEDKPTKHKIYTEIQLDMNRGSRDISSKHLANLIIVYMHNSMPAAESLLVKVVEKSTYSTLCQVSKKNPADLKFKEAPVSSITQGHKLDKPERVGEFISIYRNKMYALVRLRLGFEFDQVITGKTKCRYELLLKLPARELKDPKKEYTIKMLKNLFSELNPLLYKRYQIVISEASLDS